MKTYLSLKKPLQKLCESYLQSLESFYCSLFLLFRAKKKEASHHVHQGTQHFRRASMSLLSNSRYLVGGIMLIMVVISFYLPQFFSGFKSLRDYTWYYRNWYYQIYALRPWMMALFGSVALLYFWPSKSKSVYIVFTLFHAVAWLEIIHLSFFTFDDPSFHAIPLWSVFVMAGSFATGFVVASDHLVYVFEHKIKGNHKRFVGLAEMTGVDPELRDRMLKDNANEYRRLYTNY
jgi:hypothetical protein